MRLSSKPGKAVPVLLAAVLALAACSRQPAASPPRDLNVLLVTLDTTRADHLSCYAADSVAPASSPANRAAMGTTRPDLSGSPLQPPSRPRGAQTPHLDALAARGVRFAHAIAQVPLTLPSHACMFTGTYPEVHQLRDMGGFVLDPKHLTLARMCRTAGFRTAAFVGSKAVGRQFGLQQGFDVYDDRMTSHDEEGKLPGVFPERRATVTTDRAIDWLKQVGRQRFFLWVHYYDPHDPYDPPEPFKTTYREDPYSGGSYGS